MKTITLVIAGSLLIAQNARTQQEAEKEDVPKKIPDEHKESSIKTFESGKQYFIWHLGEEPLQGKAYPPPVMGGISFAWIDLGVAGSPKITHGHFRKRASIKVTDPKTKERQVITSTDKEDREPVKLGKINSTAQAGRGKKLIGDGTIEVYLIDADEKDKDDANPISNVLSLKVEFRDALE